MRFRPRIVTRTLIWNLTWAFDPESSSSSSSSASGGGSDFLVQLQASPSFPVCLSTHWFNFGSDRSTKKAGVSGKPHLLVSQQYLNFESITLEIVTKKAYLYATQNVVWDKNIIQTLYHDACVPDSSRDYPTEISLPIFILTGDWSSRVAFW